MKYIGAWSPENEIDNCGFALKEFKESNSSLGRESP
jgi:hypothetical protein